MANRHLWPVVVAVGLLAGLLGAFLGFAITEDEDAPPFEAVPPGERGVVIERGILTGAGTAQQTMFPLGVPDTVARVMVEQCGDAFSRSESASAGFCAGTLSISISVTGEVRQITVPVACAVAVRVGDSWPTGLEECR